MSLIAVTLNQFGAYGDGEIDWEKGYVYIALVQNFTQLASLYALVWLYVAMKNELAPFKPMSKFIVVKAVVFFTFWQSVLLAILVHMSVIKDTETLKVGEVQVGLQDLLVCIEMFIAACFHKYTFGYETYANGSMKLLMDQRALQIAQLTYDRAVKQASQRQEHEARLRKRKRRMKRLARQAMADATGMDVNSIVIVDKSKKKSSKKKQLTTTTKQATIDATRDLVADAQSSAELHSQTSQPHISIDVSNASNNGNPRTSGTGSSGGIVLRAVTPPMNSAPSHRTLPTTVELNSPLFHQLLSPRSATNTMSGDDTETSGQGSLIIGDSEAALFDESRVRDELNGRQATFEELLVDSVRAGMRKQEIEQRMARREARRLRGTQSNSNASSNAQSSPVTTQGYSVLNTQTPVMADDVLSPVADRSPSVAASSQPERVS